MKIIFGGHDMILDPSGAAVFPGLGLAVVSDMHLEKGSHFAKRGFFLPPYDSRMTLAKLLEFFTRHHVRQLVILGDCFHDASGHGRMDDETRAQFDRLKTFDPIWIRGNHDGCFVPDGFCAYDAYARNGLVFRHQAETGATSEISGHFHPKAAIAHKGARIERPCFVEDGDRMIMPAFGAYAGGLSIADPAIANVFEPPVRFYLLARDRVLAFDASAAL